VTPDVRLAILEGDAAAGIGFARRGARVARTAGPPLETVLIAMAKVRLAMAAMGKPKTKVADLCRELGVTRQTLYTRLLLRFDARTASVLNPQPFPISFVAIHFVF
jgi:hypothetical protein